MKRTKVIDALKSTDYGTDINVKGWVRSHRSSKAVDFIALNDGSTIKNIQVVVDPSTMDAEELKRKLSEKKEASVKVNAKGYKGIMSLTMKEFAALSAPIFKKIYVPIQNVLRDSGNKPEDIDEVIAVAKEVF